MKKFFAFFGALIIAGALIVGSTSLPCCAEDPPAWKVAGGTGSISLGNYRVIIDNVIYISSVPCTIYYETDSYSETYLYVRSSNTSAWMGSGGRFTIGNFTVNSSNTVYNRIQASNGSSRLFAIYVENNQTLRTLEIFTGDKLYFETDPENTAGSTGLNILSTYFNRNVQPSGTYTINFDVPLSIQVGNNLWTWDGDRSTFYLYQAYDEVLISMVDQHGLMPVLVHHNVAAYNIETMISNEWGTRTDGWNWLIDIMMHSNSDTATYYRFVVEMVETNMNDISGQLAEILGNPNQPLPQSVLIAQGVKQEVEAEFDEPNLIVGQLTDDIDTIYAPAVEAAAEEHITDLMQNVSQEETASLSNAFSWIFTLGVLADFIVVMAIVKVFVNAHRKMGD